MTHDISMPAAVTAAVEARYGTAHVHAGFDPARTALLVVDMQDAFLLPEIGYVPCAAARGIIPAINRLAIALRGAGGTVAWLKNVHEEEMRASWSSMYAMLGQEGARRRAAALAEDAPGFRLSAELAVAPDDPIIVKRRYSAFLQGSSDIEPMLRAREIDTVIVTGCTTDVCVESTARDAMMRDFRVIVVADATAAMTDAAHLGALTGLYMNFADVMPAAMVAARCSGFAGRI